MSLLWLFFLMAEPHPIPILKSFLFCLIGFILIYILVSYFTEKFIFRKIKLIYKVITDSKDSLKDAQDLLSNSTSLEQVNTSVLEWAQNTENEISSLKTLEEYRKQFLGDVSHELKTPLFSIQGYLHTLLEGGLYDENINNLYLKKAILNVERLETIVKDLEMINSLETNNQHMNIVDFDLRELTEEVFADLDIQAAKRDIKLLFKQGADKNFLVSADKEKIRQVLINLVSNSIKYGNEGGYTKVSYYDMDERILVEVSDNGIGMKQEDIKHVFDRFYRADKHRNRSVGGSGLGLAIVKHIIEAHQQKITLRSTNNLGSTFGFTLSKKV